MANTVKSVSPNELVRVESCWDVPRADLVQMALAREGIPSSLGNAAFLSWFWHCGNAVGGATVHVRRCDAEQARNVLVAARAKPTESLPPWICSSCGQRVAGQWDACWQCGHFADGTPGSAFDDAAAQPEGPSQAAPWLNVSRLFTIVASAVLAIKLLLMSDPLSLSIFVSFAVVVVFLLRQFETPAAGPSEPQQSADSRDRARGNLSTTQSAVSRAIVQRAWQAAVLAIGFLPLGFYSMRLLWKLGNRDTPLSRADTWRCWAAFILNIATALPCLLFAGALLLAVLNALVRL